LRHSSQVCHCAWAVMPVKMPSTADTPITISFRRGSSADR
jgi:hypothetical protein